MIEKKKQGQPQKKAGELVMEECLYQTGKGAILFKDEAKVQMGQDQFE